MVALNWPPVKKLPHIMIDDCYYDSDDDDGQQDWYNFHLPWFVRILKLKAFAIFCVNFCKC